MDSSLLGDHLSATTYGKRSLGSTVRSIGLSDSMLGKG